MTADLRRTTYKVAGDYEISVAEAGEGPAVVFLHGSGPGASGTANFRGNYRAFVDAGYRVLLPDLIGYGYSSKPEGIDYTLQLFTDTMHEALAQAGVDHAAALVGNSLGGGVAMQMVFDHAGFADKLVMMAPGCIEELSIYFAMPGIAGMKSSFGSPDFNEEDQRALIRNLMFEGGGKHVTDELVAERFAVARTQSKDVLARMRTPNLAPRLGELTMPILGFWGLQDTFCPASGAQRFLDACSDARFMTFNKVGHWVQVERAEEFNRYATAFVRG